MKNLQAFNIDFLPCMGYYNNIIKLRGLNFKVGSIFPQVGCYSIAFEFISCYEERFSYRVEVKFALVVRFFKSVHNGQSVFHGSTWARSVELFY